MRKLFSWLILHIVFNLAHAWFENCDKKYFLSTTTSLVLQNTEYPNYYVPGTSCKYYLEAPIGYTIEVKCIYDLYATVSGCESQRLYLSRDGDKNLSYSEFVCGASNLTRVSVGNEFSFGYTSNQGARGRYTCTAKTIQTTQANCQCGWSKSVR
jgi:hypothetical protein